MSSNNINGGRDQNNCIVLLDDSSSDGDAESPRQPLAAPPSVNKAASAMIDSLMDVMQLTDRAFAKETLQRFDHDLQKAVSHLLMERKECNRDSVKRSLFKSSARRRHQHSQWKPDCDLNADDVSAKKARLIQSELSRQWQEAYKQACESGSYYIDTTFRPESSSIDGRMRQPDNITAAAATLTVKCYCNVLAKPMSVQSEGPDYGRFYLACGNKGTFKRRAPVLRERSPPVKQSDEAAKSSKTSSTNTSSVIQNPYAKHKITTADNASTTTITTPSTPPQRFGCDFFQWDRHGTHGAALHDAYAMGRFQKVQWKHFGLETKHVLCQHHTSKSHSIQQGAIGNCWFLSALAVVAEQPYLIDRVLPHVELNDKGVYQVNLCLDGKWTPVIVDSYLPVVERDLLQHGKRGGKQSASQQSPKKQKGSPVQQLRQQTLAASSTSGGGGTSSSSLINYRTAFCATPDKQLWPALIEKAYAKAHGSYANLSGGFIEEGLTDLTGAPTETILLDEGALINNDELWARLLSFAQAGFIMGVATSRGGDGLVGGHAYSILDVIEIADLMVGEQAKMTNFFGSSSAASDQVQIVESGSSQRRQTIRLVRIRNPWGKREWKGEWSADSERWTKALRTRLGSTTYAKGDGTFFMAFGDMIQRFHHMDVAKTCQGWVFSSADGLFQQSNDPINSSQTIYKLTAADRTWAFISLVQPKKRANTSWKYYYCDCSFMILKRKHEEIDWACETVILAGVKRTICAEVFLDPAIYEYICVPFSCIGAKFDAFTFRLSAYSASAVEIVASTCQQLSLEAVLIALHKDLLRRNHKLLYPVAGGALLCCIHGEGCLYFVAINGSVDSYLSIKLTYEVTSGIHVVFGMESETYDIAPHCQQVLIILSGNGKFSTATDIAFRYMCSQVLVRKDMSAATSQTPHRSSKTLGVGIALTMAGDLLVSNIDLARIKPKGGDTVDTYLWIPQLGAS
ncbi:hypothetical protein MPSEU_000067100 [Mayamaea pseudoterrestris]|nr:hypothetical protein MPSEU_000067100 [Mayamaea pseudoterrestris]